MYYVTHWLNLMSSFKKRSNYDLIILQQDIMHAFASWKLLSPEKSGKVESWKKKNNLNFLDE